MRDEWFRQLVLAQIVLPSSPFVPCAVCGSELCFQASVGPLWMPLEQYNQLNTAAAANLKQLAADGEGRALF